MSYLLNLWLATSHVDLQPHHSGAFTWGKVTFALKNYISFIYKPIFTNEGLKFLERIVLDDTL